MIDLRKPLEGVPGLLLMGALILFGATVGMGVAIGFTWIPMSDALANFLGGVVGAGLGAALAVMGAVYVQHVDVRVRRSVPANEIVYAARDLHLALKVVRRALETNLPPISPDRNWEDEYDALVGRCEAVAMNMPSGAELSREVHQRIIFIKRAVPSLLRRIQKRGREMYEGKAPKVREKYARECEDVMWQLQKIRESADTLGK